MKKALLIFQLFSLSIFCFGQEIEGYEIRDYLVEATHPICEEASNKYVLGLPNDSCWVNFPNGSTIEAYFGSTWGNGEGDDLVIEAGYSYDVFQVQLILADGSYSETYTTVPDDWTIIGSFVWGIFYQSSCSDGEFIGDHTLVALDFEDDFGLSDTDVVSGILITSVETNENDFAGVYIVEDATLVNLQEISNQTNLELFPNPTQGVVNLEFSSHSYYELVLTDLFGKEVITSSFTGQSHRLSLGNLTNGTYVLCVKTENGQIVEKIVKQ